MTAEAIALDAMEAHARRREERREFFRSIATAAAIVGGAAATVTTAVRAQTTLTDADILNFALNLEYLEAQFYSFASFGEGLPANLLDGAGTRGEATGGRAVNFTDPVVRQYAREIALDERAHVEFLRGALGAAKVAQPAINIGGGQNGAFTAAARAAGLAPADGVFDPYANDENFLLGAFIFEDVGVTAYKGASPLLTSKVFLEAAAGILAVEAYHAGLVRTTLFRKGVDTPALRDATVAISNARDSLDGPEDKDQGVTLVNDMSNIAPLDEDGLAYSRTPGEVLNIVYLNKEAVTQGGFFPAGVNGTIKTSDDN